MVGKRKRISKDSVRSIALRQKTDDDLTGIIHSDIIRVHPSAIRQYRDRLYDGYKNYISFQTRTRSSLYTNYKVRYKVITVGNKEYKFEVRDQPLREHYLEHFPTGGTRISHCTVYQYPKIIQNRKVKDCFIVKRFDNFAYDFVINCSFGKTLLKWMAVILKDDLEEYHVSVVGPVVLKECNEQLASCNQIFLHNHPLSTVLEYLS